jgi:succinate dehydrogenase/fumarate reductase flavoprotein subunit
MGAGTMYPAMGFGLNHAAVTGNRAGLGAAEYASKSKEIKIDEGELKRVKTITCLPMERKGGFTPDWVTQVLHGYSIPYFFLQIKHKDRLQPSLKLVEFLNNHLVPKLIAKNPHQWRMAHETKNMALIVEIMLRSSLFRTESRGPHFREDYPYRDDPAWLAWIKVKEAQGKMKVYKQPVPKKWWPDLTRTYEERYPTMLPGEEV